MKAWRSYFIAVASGLALAWIMPAVMAFMTALPGLGVLLRAIKAAGVPVVAYSILVGYLPTLLVSFAVGAALRRYVSGAGVGHLLACSTAWTVYMAAILIWIYAGTDVDWYFDIGDAAVPLGVLLAAFVPSPPSMDRPGNSPVPSA
jgi:hypothetical protein